MNVCSRRVLCFLSALCFALPAASCGPDFPSAIFVKQYRPDDPYAKFVAGRLGVPRDSYRIRQLAITYNVLTGRALSATEREQAIRADAVLAGTLEQDPTKPTDGLAAWLRARQAFGPVNGVSGVLEASGVSGALDASSIVTRSVPGVDYEQFANCMDDAFATAARTLGQRQAAYG